MSGEEFLRRFVQHVLPRGFVKIRHYGLPAFRGRKERLALCRRLLLPATVASCPTADGAVSEDVRPAGRRVVRSVGGQRLSVQELTADEALRLSGMLTDSS